MYLISIYPKICVIYSLCPSAFIIISSASLSFLNSSSSCFCFYWMRLSPILETFVISLSFSARILILVLLTTTCSTDLRRLFTEFIFYFRIFNSAYFFKSGSLGSIASFMTFYSYFSASYSSISLSICLWILIPSSILLFWNCSISENTKGEYI